MNFDYYEEYLTSISNEALLWRKEEEKQKEKLIQTLIFSKPLSCSWGIKLKE